MPLPSVVKVECICVSTYKSALYFFVLAPKTEGIKVVSIFSVSFSLSLSLFFPFPFSPIHNFSSLPSFSPCPFLSFIHCSRSQAFLRFFNPTFSPHINSQAPSSTSLCRAVQGTCSLIVVLEEGTLFPHTPSLNTSSWSRPPEVFSLLFFHHPATSALFPTE